MFSYSPSFVGAVFPIYRQPHYVQQTSPSVQQQSDACIWPKRRPQRRPQRHLALTSCCADGSSSTDESNSSKATPLFEMRNISYSVPRNIDLVLFENMNFNIYPGEFVIMLGANGSGKSTAINIMLGLEKARRHSEFYWKGDKIKADKMLQHCGIVFQNPSKYFMCQKVIDELRYGRPMRTPDDIRKVLTDVGLTDISLMANPKSLSGGQIRRLAVADQMIKEPTPELFLLDEPLSGVDWTARKDIVKFLKTLKSSLKLSVLLVSHEPGEVLQFADRVVELKDRRIVPIGKHIVQKAITVREQLKREKRTRAVEEARLYRLQMREKKEGVVEG